MLLIGPQPHQEHVEQPNSIASPASPSSCGRNDFLRRPFFTTFFVGGHNFLPPRLLTTFAAFFNTVFPPAPFTTFPARSTPSESTSPPMRIKRRKFGTSNQRIHQRIPSRENPCSVASAVRESAPA